MPYLLSTVYLEMLLMKVKSISVLTGMISGL